MSNLVLNPISVFIRTICFKSIFVVSQRMLSDCPLVHSTVTFPVDTFITSVTEEQINESKLAGFSSGSYFFVFVLFYSVTL